MRVAGLAFGFGVGLFWFCVWWGGRERGPGDIKEVSDVGLPGSPSGTPVAGATPDYAFDPCDSGSFAGPWEFELASAFGS